MFVLIQRGQSFVDANNYPVEICKVTLTQVIYRRLDGRTRATSIGAFNEEFERVDHNELHMIKAEHAGDTCSAFSDVVNFVVGRTQDFAGSAVVVDVPGVRKNDSEHFYTSVGRC